MEELLNSMEYYSDKGCTDAQIETAEQELNLRFASDYREYLKRHGAIVVNSHELTGITDDKRINVVDATRSCRVLTPSIPKDWYVIEEANIDGIVLWQSQDASIYEVCGTETPRKIAVDMADYLRRF